MEIKKLIRNWRFWIIILVIIFVIVFFIFGQDLTWNCHASKAGSHCHNLWNADWGHIH